MSWRRWGPAAAVCGLLLVGCSSGGDEDVGDQPTTEDDRQDAVADDSVPTELRESLPIGRPASAPASPPAGPVARNVARSDVVVLDGADGRLRYALGPVEVSGDALAGVQAVFQGQWVVLIDFNAEGSQQFDLMAETNFGRQVAIVFDGRVLSAPVINATDFDGAAAIGGLADEADARALARDLFADGSRLEFRPVLLSVLVGEGGQALIDAYLGSLPE